MKSTSFFQSLQTINGAVDSGNRLVLNDAPRQPKGSGQRSTKLCLQALILLLALLFVGAAFHPAQAAEPENVIKIATLAPEGSAWMKIFGEMNDKLLAESQGRLKFKVYPGGILGDEEDVLRKVRAGQLQGGGFTSMALTKIVPDFRVMAIPMTFKDYDEVDAVWKMIQPYWEGRFKTEGFEALGWPKIGFSYTYSNVAIRSVADLRSAKPWSWEGDPLMTEMFKAANVKGVNLAMTDVLTGLQTGLVDTVFGPPSGLIAMQWFTKIKYMTDYRLSHGFGGVIVTSKVFDKLPADLQTIMKNVVTEYCEKLTASGRKENEDAIAAMKKQGVTEVALSEEGRKQFEDIRKTTIDAMVGQYFARDVLDKLLAFIDAYHKTAAAPK